MTKKTYSPEVQEAINAARDISSDGNVNLQQAAEYLAHVCPDAFDTYSDAAKAITGEEDIPAKTEQPTE